MVEPTNVQTSFLRKLIVLEGLRHRQGALYDMWQSAVQGGAGETISETSETKR